MINFITSLNFDLFQKYGLKFFETFDKFAGDDCKLIVVFEGEILTIPTNQFKKISYIPFESSPQQRFLKFFGNLYEARGLRIIETNTAYLGKQVKLTHDYKYDAIRFSFKIFSINLARKQLANSKNFAWIDSDVVCLKPFCSSDISKFMPQANQLMSYLGRSRFPEPNAYSECGFLGFNSMHPLINPFLNKLEEIYTSGEIFSFKEWHDSWLWDELRKEYQLKKVDFKNISEKFMDTDHPFINSGLGEFFDHLKGPERKKMGKSFDTDYKK